MFSAAYLAEVFRGGLQAITRGQYEAAHALSLSKWQTLTRVVLPQALRITIPATASLFIGAVKETSLVSIVNVYDLTGTLRMALSEAEWRPYFVEMYIMVSAVYLTIGLSIASYGRYLERRYALK
jgi:general L-amino acid transport system permease protein